MAQGRDRHAGDRALGRRYGYIFDVPDRHGGPLAFTGTPPGTGGECGAAPDPRPEEAGRRSTTGSIGWRTCRGSSGVIDRLPHVEGHAGRRSTGPVRRDLPRGGPALRRRGRRRTRSSRRGTRTMMTGALADPAAGRARLGVTSTWSTWTSTSTTRATTLSPGQGRHGAYLEELFGHRSASPGSLWYPPRCLPAVAHQRDPAGLADVPHRLRHASSTDRHGTGTGGRVLPLHGPARPMRW